MSTPPDLLPHHLLARFILDRKQIRAMPPRIKPRTFLPRYDGAVGQVSLSTFRVDGLAETEIWDIGTEHIEARAGRLLKARADLLVQAYQDLGLQTIFDNSPPRHVNVLGWPEAKEERLALAQELAAAVAAQNGFHERPQPENQS